MSPFPLSLPPSNGLNHKHTAAASNAANFIERDLLLWNYTSFFIFFFHALRPQNALTSFCYLCNFARALSVRHKTLHSRRVHWRAASERARFATSDHREPLSKIDKRNLTILKYNQRTSSGSSTTTITTVYMAKFIAILVKLLGVMSACIDRIIAFIVIIIFYYLLQQNNRLFIELYNIVCVPFRGRVSRACTVAKQ